MSAAPRKRAPRKPKVPPPPPPPAPPKKSRSRAFRKAALAASALATLAVLGPHLAALNRRKPPPQQLGGVPPYVIGGITTTQEAELENLVEEVVAEVAEVELSDGDEGDIPPPQHMLDAVAQQAAEAAALEEMHRIGAASMAAHASKGKKKKKKFFVGRGLTGEAAGSGHVAALWGSGLLSSAKFNVAAAGIKDRLQRTRAIKPGQKLKLVEAGRKYLKHVSPRRVLAKITRPESLAAIGALLAATAMVGGGQQHLAKALRAGMKLAALRQVVPANALHEPGVVDGAELYPQRATHKGPGPEGYYPRKASAVKVGGLGSVAPKKKAVAPKRKARPKPLDAMTMAEKNAAGFASSHGAGMAGAGMAGQRRLPGACHGGCNHKACRARLSTALTQ